MGQILCLDARKVKAYGLTHRKRRTQMAFQGSETIEEGANYRLVRSGHPEHPEGVLLIEFYPADGGMETIEVQSMDEATASLAEIKAMTETLS
jgi:hypothetical protein